MYDRDDPSSETEEAGETGEVVDCDAGQENDDANPKCTLEPVQVRVIGRRLAMFMIASDERRRVRYERVDDKPWRVERHVDRGNGRTWVSCGGKARSEFMVEGEHRAGGIVMEGPGVDFTTSWRTCSSRPPATGAHRVGRAQR